MKDRIITGIFLLYVGILAVGTVDQVFLDSILFPPALDRQLLGMVDVLRDRRPSTVGEAQKAAEDIRQHLVDIRLEREVPKLELDLAQYASAGMTLEALMPLLDQARKQAVANLVDNDEFSLGICIRALDPDLALKLWVPGCDDAQVKKGCLEALKTIGKQTDGFGYDPNASAASNAQAVQSWRKWHVAFMEERRRPAPPAPLPPVQTPAAPTATSPTPAAPPQPQGGAIPAPR